jgi:hypothetical protein
MMAETLEGSIDEGWRKVEVLAEEVKEASS